MCYGDNELKITETMLLSRVIRFKIASDLPRKGRVEVLFEFEA